MRKTFGGRPVCIPFVLFNQHCPVHSVLDGMDGWLGRVGSERKHGDKMGEILYFREVTYLDRGIISNV